MKGTKLNERFRSSENIEKAEVDEKKFNFLYSDDNNSFFMDNVNFEQYELNNELIGNTEKFLSEGNNISIIFLESTPLAIELPTSIIMTVENTDVGLKGDTQSGATKPATTTSGLTLQVPLFIEEGQKINVSTNDGSYLGRS